MHIGISAPLRGVAARPAAVNAVAAAAEQVGYASVWAADGPSEQGLDAFVVLGAIAVGTRRIGLGIGPVLLARHDPDVLARSLSTLQSVASGRLSLACPVGSRDELARLLDGLDRATASCATSDPATPYRRPPVLVTGHDDGALDTAGALGDGWSPVDLPAAAVTAAWSRVRAVAAAAGRDPDELRLVTRVTVRLEAATRGGQPFRGPLDGVVAELAALGDAGVHEVVLGVDDDLGVDEVLDTYARVAEALDGS